MPDLGVIICGAVPVLLVALGMWVYNAWILLRYSRAIGTVVGYDRIHSGKGQGDEAEIVEFQLPDGKSVTFIDKAYLNRIILWEGQQVKVLYDPNQPSRARVNKFMNLHFAPIVLTLVGIGIIVYSVPSFSGPIKHFFDGLLALLNKF